MKAAIEKASHKVAKRAKERNSATSEREVAD